MSLLCVEGLEGEGEGWQALLAPRQLSSQMLQLRLLQIPVAANKPCHTLAPLLCPQLRRRRLVVVGQEINRESRCEPGGGHDLHEIWERRPRE